MRISDWSSDVCSSDLQQRTFSEVALDGPHRRIDEFGPVEHDLHFDARWQRLRNLIKLGRYVLRHDTTVFVDEHEDGADHRFLAVHAACAGRSEEHTSELQSLMRTSFAVFCLKKKNKTSK